MKGIVFALPPLAEQETVLSALDEQTLDLGKAIQQARREIDFLREYRTRLIADVVTGKLDVREAAARLPDEWDDEVAAFDEAESLAEGDEDGEGVDLEAATDEAGI